MSYLGSYKVDDYLTFCCNTHDPDTGVATDADAVPTYRVYEDETATPILTGSTALLDAANTAGFYSERIQLTAASGLEKGKCYTIYITATVGTDTGTMHHNFQIEAEVDANTVSASNVSANIAQISGDTTAADNAEAFFDGTGYAGTNNVIPTVTTLTGHTAQTGDNYARLGAPAGASVSADIVAIEAQTDDIGVAGAGLTAVPWNAAWDAEMQSEVQDALEANDLDHLIQVSAGAEEPTDGSYLDQVMHKDVSQTFDPTTDSLEAIRDTAPLGTAMRGTDSAALASVCTETRLAELDAANLPTDVADVPTVAEFNARTQPTADYFDPAADTVANVTLVATTTTNSDMVGTDSAALASVCTETRLAELDAANLPTDIADVPTVAEFNARTQPTADYFDPAADAVANVTLVATTTTNSDMRGTDSAALASGVNCTQVEGGDATDAIQAAADAALVANHLDHLLKTTYDPAAKPGTADALLNELIESDAGVSRYTANALEEAPTGGSAPTVAEIRTEMDDNSTQLAAIVADTNELQIDDIPGAISGLNDPTAAAIRTEIDSNSTQLAAIVVDTNELQTDDVPGLITALNDVSVTDVTQRQIPDSVPADGTRPTIEQALYMITQFLYERGIVDTTMTVKKVDGSTALMTLTLDDGTDPTSYTRAT